MTNEELANRQKWDAVAEVHYRAYNLSPLRNGGIVLDDISVGEVGNVNGKRLLHLQCNIGSDTLSWARLGAEVTGVDFSGRSLDVAKRLQTELGLKARWIESDILSLPEKLNETFDVIVATQGVVCWISDLNRWMKIAADFLQINGALYLMDSHPILNAVTRETDEYRFEFDYFMKEPTRYEDHGDYADWEFRSPTPLTAYEWTWSMSDIINTVAKAGLTIEFLNEYDKLFYRESPFWQSDGKGWWIHQRYYRKIPAMFTLRAIKKQK